MNNHFLLNMVQSINFQPEEFNEKAENKKYKKYMTNKIMKQQLRQLQKHKLLALVVFSFLCS